MYVCMYGSIVLYVVLLYVALAAEFTPHVTSQNPPSTVHPSHHITSPLHHFNTPQCLQSILSSRIVVFIFDFRFFIFHFSFYFWMGYVGVAFLGWTLDSNSNCLAGTGANLP